MNERMNHSVWNVDSFKSVLKMKTIAFLFNYLRMNKIRFLDPYHRFNHVFTPVLKESVLSIPVPLVVIVFVFSFLDCRNYLESLSSSRFVPESSLCSCESLSD